MTINDVIKTLKFERSADALAAYLTPYQEQGQAAQQVLNVMGIQTQQASPLQGLQGFVNTGGTTNPPPNLPNLSHITTGHHNVAVGASALAMPPIPPPSGRLIAIDVWDAVGTTHRITVDQAHVHLFQSVMAVYCQGAVDPFAPRIGDDFSLSEMDEAKSIMDDLD